MVVDVEWTCILNMKHAIIWFVSFILTMDEIHIIMVGFFLERIVIMLTF